MKISCDKGTTFPTSFQYWVMDIWITMFRCLSNEGKKQTRTTKNEKTSVSRESEMHFTTLDKHNNFTELGLDWAI